MALTAASRGIRDAYRHLNRVADKFPEAEGDTFIRQHEALLLLDSMNNTLITLKGIEEKIKISDKKKEEKQASLDKTAILIDTTTGIVNKLKERIISNVK
jgi:hypothetical protein